MCVIEKDAIKRYICRLVLEYKYRGAETLFIARNSREFCTSVEKEKSVIEDVLSDTDSEWFVAEYEGRVVGQCSAGLVRRYQRYRHRAEVDFIVLKEYSSIGIGGRMMQEHIKWCWEKV